jgi:hypothetical protein
MLEQIDGRDVSDARCLKRLSEQVTRINSEHQNSLVPGEPEAAAVRASA